MIFISFIPSALHNLIQFANFFVFRLISDRTNYLCDLLSRLDTFQQTATQNIFDDTDDVER